MRNQRVRLVIDDGASRAARLADAPVTVNVKAIVIPDEIEDPKKVPIPKGLVEVVPGDTPGTLMVLDPGWDPPKRRRSAPAKPREDKPAGEQPAG